MEHETTTIPETTIKIGSSERVFQFFETNAPPRYDYGSTFTVYDYEERKGGEKTGKRIVMIEKEKVSYQIGRNASGLFYTNPMEPYLLDHCENILYRRMFPEQVDR
jgi:hypothetical protein